MQYKIVLILLITVGFSHASDFYMRPVTDDLKSIYGSESYLLAGTNKTVHCNNYRKVEWIDPKHNRIKPFNTAGSDARVYTRNGLVRTWDGNAHVSNLTLTKLEVDDSGLWYCLSAGQKTPVAICVIDPTVFENTRSNIETAHTGRSHTLRCEVRGNPEPKVQWYRDEVLLRDFDLSEYPPKYRVITRHTGRGVAVSLTITPLEPSDTAVYTCEAIQQSLIFTNCTATRKRDLYLFVHSAPYFENSSENFSYVYGGFNEKITLKCIAKGNPIPSYRWFRDKSRSVLEEIEDSVLEVQDGSVVSYLVVPVLQPEETIRCRASNDLGDAETIFTIVQSDSKAEIILNTTSAENTTETEFNETTTAETDIEIDYCSSSIIHKYCFYIIIGMASMYIVTILISFPIFAYSTMAWKLIYLFVSVVLIPSLIALLYVFVY